MRTSEGSLSGPITLDNIDNLYADIGFLAVVALICKQALPTTTSKKLKFQKMMSHCRMKVILADHTKFEKTHFIKLQTLVTWTPLSPMNN